MRQRCVMPFLTLMAATILALPVEAQEKPKPFMRGQVQGMVRDGPADGSGPKLVEQRGIDFALTESFLQNLVGGGLLCLKKLW